MNLGIDKALCLKLGYVVITTHSAYISKEVVLICQCFTEIYKCSSTNQLRSFRHVGATKLLPLLIQLAKDHIRIGTDRENRSTEDDDGLVSLIRVLRVFSKLSPAKSFLINYSKGTFLGHLVRNVLIWINKPGSSVFSSSTDALWEILGLVKDLTFRSRTDDKKMLLHMEGEILFRLLSICFNKIQEFHPRFQEWCTAITWNLVLDIPIRQKILSKSVSHNNQLGNVIVESLLRVLVQHSAHGKNSTLSLKIKRNATSALGNIFSDSKNHEILFQNSCDTNLSTLIPQLACSAQQDFDPVTRRRAMRTIRCIACSSVIWMKNLIQKGNLSSLLIDIISRKRAHEDEDDHDMLVQACQTVIAMRESMKIEDRCHLQGVLLELIQNTTSTDVISAATLCLSACLNQGPIALNPSFFSAKVWNNLERLVSASSEIHAAVSQLFTVIVKIEKGSGTVGAQDLENPSILTKTPVINALTTILLESKSGGEQARNLSLDVVQILAEKEINKRLLAGNDRLLSGLVTLCLLQPDSEIKDSAKKIILQLVPEI